MSKIEQIIEELQTYVSECKSPTFGGGGKIICERNAMEDFIEDLRLSTPEEIKKYQKIISQKDMILADAKSQSSAMIAEAQRQTQKMIDEHEIMQRAYEEAQKLVETAKEDAQRIVDSATEDANTIKESAIRYTDDMLAGLQDIVDGAINEQEDRQVALIGNLREVSATVAQNRQELVPQLDPEAAEGYGDGFERVDDAAGEDGEVFLRDTFDNEE